MSLELIHNTFNADLHVFSVANDIVVAWDNVPFPKQGLAPISATVPVLKEALMPAETSSSGLGEDAENRHRGVYQVLVQYPANIGVGIPSAMADKVCKHFHRGKSYLAGKLRIEKSYPNSSGKKSDTQYIIPVTIYYVGYFPAK